MKYTLTQDNLKSIAIGALMAMAGALLTYLNAIIVETNFTFCYEVCLDYTPAVVALWSILANTARKFLSE